MRRQVMAGWVRGAVACGAVMALAACASSQGPGGEASVYKSSSLRPYSVGGRRYTPKIQDGYSEKGVASWYSYPKGTRRTATGEAFDPSGLTAAHKTLPLPCIVEVTNLDNGRKLKVRVNDRGPFVQGRIIDLSRAAAQRLGIAGTARVKVRFIGPAGQAALGGVEAAQAGDVVLASVGDQGAAPLG
jgi:rare lipoprotein A